MTGLGSSLRLAWRRSRLFWTLWVLGVASLLPATVTKYHDLVPEGPEAAGMLAGLAANPTMRAMLGPVYDLSTPGGFTFWRVGTFTAAAAAMMAALGVIRATRAEEEDGRIELLRSGPIARHAPLAGAVAMAWLACVVLGLLVAGGLVACGTPVPGAVLSGAGIGLTGAMFAGLGAVCAQVFETARAARSWSLGLGLGGLYLARAAVDGAQDGDTMQLLRWANPLEWAALARPFAGDRGWVLLLPLLVAVLLAGLAFALEARRDHGAGLVAARPGRASASASLSGPFGLAWRLHRSAVLGWSVGIVASAIGMGSLSLSMDAMVASNDQVGDLLRKMGAGATELKDAFYQAMLGIMVTIITLGGILLLQRLRAEETAGRAEMVLATSASRWRLAASHLVWALGLPIVLLVATGAGLPLIDGARHGWGVVGDVTRAAVVLIPGVLLVLGLAMLLLGWAPRRFGLIWAVLGWTMFVTWLGPLFDLPTWLLRAQPWGHLPHLPSEAMAWGQVLLESGVGLALLALGLWGYRRRGIPA